VEIDELFCRDVVLFFEDGGLFGRHVHSMQVIGAAACSACGYQKKTRCDVVLFCRDVGLFCGDIGLLGGDIESLGPTTGN